MAVILVFASIVPIAIGWRYLHFRLSQRGRAIREAARRPADKTRFVIHAIELVGDSPLRASAGTTFEPPRLRDAAAVPVETVIETLVRAGLPARLHNRGFSFRLEPDRLFTVDVPDRAQVTPSAMKIATSEWELTIDAAHALVPVFGPLAIDTGAAAWLVVDGSRSISSLREELGKRYAEMARRMYDAAKDFDRRSR